MTVLIATTSSWFFPLPIQIFPFLFQDYQHIVHTAFLKGRGAKNTLPLIMKSQRSTLPTLSPLMVQPFSQFIHGLETSDISSINPKLVTPTPSNSSSLRLKTTCPPFTSEFSLHQIPKEPQQDSQTHPPNTVDHSLHP